LGFDMIDIQVIHGIPYIWNPEDWLKLRTEQRMLPRLDGALGASVNGRVRWALPFILSTVEVQYLISEGIAKTVHAPSLYDLNFWVDDGTLEKRNKELEEQQLEEFKRNRREVLEFYADHILEEKRKKGKLIDEGALNKEDYVERELAKITKLPLKMSQLHLSDPWLKESDYIPFNFPLPKTYKDKLKFLVFEDFHKRRQYWISPGIKFGGDFLAYPGDPSEYHAEFIIICPDQSTALNEACFASQCRLAHTVRKTLLIAEIEEETKQLIYYVPSHKMIDNEVQCNLTFENK